MQQKDKINQKLWLKKKEKFLTEGMSKYEFTLNDSTQVMKQEE